MSHSTRVPSDDRTPGEPTALTRTQRALVALLALGCATSYSLTGIFRHRHFDSSLDLGIFDQAVWHLSRLEAPASSIKGMPSLFADHFHPAIALLAPLYWLAPSAETLIAAQGCLFGASIVPVFVFLRRRLPWGPAFSMSAAYGLFWGLQRAANFDVHEFAFAPLVIAAAIEAMDRRAWTPFWIWCVALLFVKDDLIPWLTALGVYLAVTGERVRGALLALGSVVAFFLVIKVLVPLAAGGANYNYLVVYGDATRRLWELPVRLVTPSVKLETLVLWLAPFAFLPLRSPLALLLAPLVLERFLSSNPGHWGTSFHYSAPLAPILAMSAGDGLARMTRRLRTDAARKRLLTGTSIACVLFSSLLPGRQPHWRLLSPGHYQSVPQEAMASRVLALIPRDASVVAQTALLPHLSQRRTIYMLEPGVPDADYLVATTHLDPWPVETMEGMSRLIEERRQRGYKTIFEEDGWLLMRLVKGQK